MKKLALLIIGMVLFSGMVLAGSGLFQTDYFYDESGGQVTGVQSELYDENKNHVHSKHSGGSNSITFEYPHTGTQNNPDTFYHFFYKDCYLPLEATEEAWGTGEHIEWQNTFEKASSCRSPIDTFSIKNDEHPNEPIIVDVDATLAAQAHSAFTNAMHNWFPSGYEKHYSAQTKIEVEILHEGNVVHTDSKTVYIMMDEAKNVQFSWTPGKEGKFTAKITTDVIDCQCESSSKRQSSKDFEIWADKPYDECYTLIQELKAQPEFPEVGDNLDISFEKISNYADTNHDKTPLPTNVDYVITDSSNNVVFEDQETLPANADGENYETHSFNWQPSESGNYNIRVTGVADSSLCQGKKNPEDTANLGITVDAEEKYSVTFEVKDSESGNAISGASVSLGTQSGTTNSAGKVSFDKSPGTYGWDVTAQDYLSESGSVDVIDEDQTVEVNLEPVVDKHTVTFKVVDASTGFAVQGADVELGSYTGSTNNNGRVVFDDVEEGNYDWKVSKSGYYDSTGSVNIDGDKEVDVSLQAKTEEYDVTFEVKDCTTNDVISNGQVILDGESKPTDGQGKAVFEDVSEGTYDWEVNKFGYESKSGSVTVDEDKIIDVCLDPVTEYYDVTFNVVDSDTGDALSGALVELDGMTSTTDGSGQVVFTDVEEGSYSWEVSKDGYHSESGSVTVDDDKTVDVSLDPVIEYYDVTFNVKDSETNDPIQGALVELDGMTSTTNFWGEVVFTDVEEGSYSWEVSKDGYHSESGSVTVDEDKTIDVSLDLVIKYYDVTFNVEDSDTGDALSGALVELDGMSSTTDGSGQVVFTDVEEGSYSWEVSKDGYHSESGSVTVDEDKTIDVSLDPVIKYYDVTFHVTDYYTGEGLDGAEVTLSGDVKITDAGGRVFFESVEEGSYAWEVKKEGYNFKEGDVFVDEDKTLNVSLKAYQAPELNVHDQFLKPGSGFNEQAVDLWEYTTPGDIPIENLEFSLLSQSNTSVVDCSLSSNRYLDCEVMEGVNQTYSELKVQVTDNTNFVNDSFRIWVMDKKDVIDLINPKCGDVISGKYDVEWFSAVADSIDIEYTLDDGDAWESIAEDVDNTGSYEWDTWHYESQSTYKLKAIAKDSKGNKIGSDTTCCHFTVYNDRFPTEEKEITRHSMFISQAQVIPSDEKATAGEYVQLYLSVSNNGDFDLDNVRMHATSHDFGERASAGPFDLMQGESESRVLDLYVPSYIKSGEYPVRITISNEDTTRTIYRDIDVK